MCGIAAAGLALTAISAASSFMQQQQQAKAAKAESNYRAAIDRNNALQAEFFAEDAIERGKEDEAEERLRGRLLLGQIRAQLAGSGQVVDEGSAGQLVDDQAEVNELNALTTRNTAAREAQEFRIRSGQFESQANLTQLAGRNKSSSLKAASFGTLIGGASKVAAKWYEFDRAGAFD